MSSSISIETLDLELPNIADNYKKISKRIWFQSFWDIFEISGERYSIMDDLSSSKRLFSAIEYEGAASPVNRLQMAYGSANAITYLHQVGIILKGLTDATIYVKVRDGMTIPTITDLESAQFGSRQDRYPQGL